MKIDGPPAASATPATPPTPDAYPSRSSLRCANCEATLTGDYCAQCGQHVADYHQSIWRFVADFFDNTFCWDNKVFRTLGPLFQQPGYLTREFMAGRRVRYVHPLRLFLFTSAVCLAVLHFGGGNGSSSKSASSASRRRHNAKSSSSATPTPAPGRRDPAADQDDPDPDDDEARAPAASPPPTARALPVILPSPSPSASAPAGFLSSLADAIGTPTPVPAPAGSASTSPSAAASPSLDSAHAAGPPPASPALSRPSLSSPGITPTDPADDPVAATINHAIAGKLSAVKGKDAADLGTRISRAIEEKQASGGLDRFTKDIAEGVRQRLSWVALGLLPVFAFLLRSLYWRKDTFYFLHLVFSLHYHTFLLLFWTAYSWLSTWMSGTLLHAVAMLLLLTPPFYLFLALRRVYGGSVRRTLLKVFLLGGAHLLAIIIGLAAIGGLAFFSAVQ